MAPAPPTRWRSEDRPCPLCGGARSRRLGARGGRAHRSGRGIEANVVACRDCGVVYTHPTLLPETNPYDVEPPEEYFSLHDREQKIRSGETFAARAESILGAPGRMLELGCGCGELLVGARNRGWSPAGVEMTEGYARVAVEQGLEVECAPVESCRALDRTYDLVLLVAILEHLYQPMATLARVHKALRPGGLLYIDVPNEASLGTRIGNAYMRARGRDWVVNLSPTFPPFHVVGFTPKSLRRALVRSGFRVLELQVPRWPNFMPPGKTLLEKVERVALGGVQALGQGLGLGDGITCWAARE